MSHSLVPPQTTPAAPATRPPSGAGVYEYFLGLQQLRGWMLRNSVAPTVARAGVR